MRYQQCLAEERREREREREQEREEQEREDQERQQKAHERYCNQYPDSPYCKRVSNRQTPVPTGAETFLCVTCQGR